MLVRRYHTAELRCDNTKQVLVLKINCLLCHLYRVGICIPFLSVKWIQSIHWQINDISEQSAECNLPDLLAHLLWLFLKRFGSKNLCKWNRWFKEGSLMSLCNRFKNDQGLTLVPSVRPTNTGIFIFTWRWMQSQVSKHNFVLIWILDEVQKNGSIEHNIASLESSYSSIRY